jgi:hypothetical protein
MEIRAIRDTEMLLGVWVSSNTEAPRADESKLNKVSRYEEVKESD